MHLETKKNRIRPYWHSTEFWAMGLAFVAWGLYGVVPGVSERDWLGSWTLVNVVYVVGRGMYKRNRGLFYSGLWTSELHVSVAGVGLVGAEVYLKFVTLSRTLWPVAAILASYMISRSLVKGLGTRTQLVVR